MSEAGAPELPVEVGNVVADPVEPAPVGAEVVEVVARVVVVVANVVVVGNVVAVGSVVAEGSVVAVGSVVADGNVVADGSVVALTPLPVGSPES
jgi:hypothetical protein